LIPDRMRIMNATKLRHWTNWAILALGIWVFISPWLVDLPEDAPIAWSNFHITGAGFIVLAARELYLPQAWVQWVVALFGGWLAISPWILEYSDHLPQTAHSIALGGVAVLFAVLGIIKHRGE